MKNCLLTLVMCLPTLATAGPAAWCDDFEATEPSLLYTVGVSPSTLDGRSDGEVVTGLWSNPRDGWLRRIAVVRTLIWNNTLAYRLDLDGTVGPGAGTWRTGNVSVPAGVGGSQQTLPVVHWQDLDDNSWTVWFRGQQVCAVVYEN